MKKIISALLILSMFVGFICVTSAETVSMQETSALNYSYDNPAGLEITSASAMLIEAKTGTVLYCKNQEEKRSPASVTKIMTLLLVCEALADEKIKLEDKVTISKYASSMGGSQVFLEEGESFTVEELLKCTVIASANDAAVALAEFTYGSEGNFVAEMNLRAKELGMKNTNFENVTGLDDTTENHVTTAEDIAIMSMELIRHDIILKYSSIWQDSIRDGEFVLTNTNRLVRFYEGCNGLKTGSTDKAGFCVSASAKRDNMQLIAVIMGASGRDVRNTEARALLDFGFANYGLYDVEEKLLENIHIKGGVENEMPIYSAPFACVVKRGELKKIEMFYDIPESIKAPAIADSVIGTVKYKIGENEIGMSEIYVKQNVEKIGFWQLFARILKNVF